MATAFQLGLGYAMKKVHENQVELEWNGIYQLLVHVDYVNLLVCDRYNTRKKQTL